MQDYLSEVTARWLLAELARTTLLLAILGVATWLVLKLARVRSPLLYRVSCVAVLLAGWTFLRWPVDVAWYQAPPVVADAAMQGEEAEVAEVVAAGEPESLTPPIDPKLLSPPPDFGAGMGSPVAVEPEVVAPSGPVMEKVPGSQAAMRPVPVAMRQARRAWNVSPEQVAVAVWLGGIVVIVGWWVLGYLRFLCQLPRGVQGAPEWQAEFAAACAEPRYQQRTGMQSRAGRVEFRVTESAGPLLCRLPRRTVLLVPRGLWSELEPAERLAILRHELEHLRRGDLWKSLAVRGLALVHWFNPVAWLAVRRFDDAAEWACDQAAMASEPTSYAAMLLRLGELAGTRARFGSAMSNRPLTTRIRRLLTPSGTEDSAMKKACLVSLLLLVMPLALVRVNLVAEEPETQPKTSQPAEGTPADVPDLSVPAPTAAEELAPPVAEPVKATADDPVKAAQRKMLEMAKQTYMVNWNAAQGGFAALDLDEAIRWSNLWLSAELNLAETREQQLAAARANLERIKVVQTAVHKLFDTGSRGGEAEKLSAVNYYVADAERRLAEIEAMPEKQAKAAHPAGDDAMLVAAARGYESTLAAYSAGNATLETVIAWSNRWLAADLEFARSREEQLAAARAHFRRIRDMHQKIAALYRTGSRGGEAPAMATADYYLADAERRVKEIEEMPEQTSAASGERPPANLDTERREQLATPRDPQIDPPSNRRSRPLTPYPEPAAGIGGQVPNVVLLIGGKYYRLDDPALPSVLKTALREGTREEMIQAMESVCLQLPHADGSTFERRFPQLAPELIALLGHRDPQIRARAENALRSIRSSIEAELQEAAKSDNAEIATRAQRLLKKSEPQPPRRPSGYFKLLSGQPQVSSPIGPTREDYSDPWAYSAQPTPTSNASVAPFYSAIDATGDTLKLLVMGKLYAWNDPAVVPALRTMLKQSDSSIVHAALILTTARPSGQSVGARTELAPDLIELLGHKDPQIQSYVEQTLLDMRPEIEAVLQEAAKSNKPEIADRVKSILDPTRKVQQAEVLSSATTGAPLASQLPDSPSRALHYDGKTFEQWRTQLQTDLSPTLRREAISAIGEFAAHGYGKETAELLVDTMRDYSVWTLGDNSPEGSLKTAAVEVALRIPAAERLPAIVEALTSGNKNQRLFALRVVPIDAPKAELVPLLEAAVAGSDAEIAELAEAPLANYDHNNPALIASIRNGLESNDQRKLQHALHMARGIITGQFARSARPYPELLPIALLLLDHADPAIKQVAVSVLSTKSLEPGQTQYVEALEQIASSGAGEAAVNARKVLDSMSPALIDRRR